MLKLIVCTDKNGLIGESNPQGNGLLWHSKEELTHYKSCTLGQVTLMGKNTAKVVPVELMRKNREVIILNRDTDIDDLLLKYCDKDIFVCGGLTIYEFFLKNYRMDELLISRLKPHIVVKTPITPLYFPNVEEYGYVLEKTIEFEDFYLEIYKEANGV
ncbi:MAG: dihydrofolate reductase [Fusobacteriaceae bacterium]